MLTDEYVKRVYAKVEERDPDQTEFLQAVQEAVSYTHLRAHETSV